MHLEAVTHSASPDNLLASYYAQQEASDTEETILAQVLRQLEPLIRKLLYHFGHWDEDLAARARERLLLALRKSHADQTPIVNLPAYTRNLIIHLITDEERKNSPRRKMVLKIRYVVTHPKYQEHLARWQYTILTMIGLRIWTGRSFQETDNYRCFCRDCDAFVQHCLTTFPLILKARQSRILPKRASTR
jgi:hypothetical protein